MDLTIPDRSLSSVYEQLQDIVKEAFVHRSDAVSFKATTIAAFGLVKIDVMVLGVRVLSLDVCCDHLRGEDSPPLLLSAVHSLGFVMSSNGLLSWTSVRCGQLDANELLAAGLRDLQVRRGECSL